MMRRTFLTSALDMPEIMSYIYSKSWKLQFSASSSIIIIEDYYLQTFLHSLKQMNPITMPPPKEKKQHSFINHTFSKPNSIIQIPASPTCITRFMHISHTKFLMQESLRLLYPTLPSKIKSVTRIEKTNNPIFSSIILLKSGIWFPRYHLSLQSHFRPVILTHILPIICPNPLWFIIQKIIIITGY